MQYCRLCYNFSKINWSECLPMPPQAAPSPNPCLAASPAVLRAVRSYLALTPIERAAFRAVIGVWARADCLPRGGTGTSERPGAGERRSPSRALLSPEGWVGAQGETMLG
jgi:hypothetical protein